MKDIFNTKQNLPDDTQVLKMAWQPIDNVINFFSLHLGCDGEVS